MAASRSSSGRPGDRRGTPGGRPAQGRGSAGRAVGGSGRGKGSGAGEARGRTPDRGAAGGPRGSAQGGSRGGAQGGPRGGTQGGSRGSAQGGSRGGAQGGPRSGPASGAAAGGRTGAKGAARGAGPERTGRRGGPARSGGPAGPRPFAASERGARRMPAVPPKGPHRKRRPKNPPVDRLDQHDPAGVRLQKLMAQAGVASRRVCEEMIEAGRVQVNGETVTELGLRVDPATAEIHVDGIRVQLDENLVYYAFNKPEGVLSTMEDPEGRPCVADFLDHRRNERVFHVGRLDVETEGLLLLTNDGELANRLTHPSYEVPKTYLVQVRGPMDKGIGAAMKAGIELEDGPARVDSFRLVDSTPGHLLVEVVLHSGRNRIVRRLFDAVGHPVEKLVRTQVGPIRIGDQRQGTVRRLSKTEVGHLLASVGM
ncbi:rRNA pseudouridine synthase [Kocuria flava]|uniref:pseudouridine synthase n=1 Tax=Kocuria flava TaxID=446860 RepID=UPI001FF3D37B|nr:pseudouridine synthase [Kocuria flava]MCJ8505411.1 rRNA pseudouridine synthase [Kocuria flava]